MRRRTALLWLACSLGAVGCGSAKPVTRKALAAAAVGQPIAVVNVNLVPMDREVVLEGYTVIIDGETIKAVGPSTSTAVPTRALKIDGRGRAQAAYRLPMGP